MIYTYVGTPPNGYWSGTFQDQSLQTLDGRYLKLDASNDPVTGACEFSNGVRVTGGTIDLTSANGEIAYGTDPLGLENTLQIKGANTGQWLRFYDGGLQIQGDNTRTGGPVYGGLYARISYQSGNTSCQTFTDRCDYANVSGNVDKSGFAAKPQGLSFPSTATGTYSGFSSFVSADTTSGKNLAYNFYAEGDAPNYFAGNVGIGTDNPLANLEVANTSGSVVSRFTSKMTLLFICNLQIQTIQMQARFAIAMLTILCVLGPTMPNACVLIKMATLVLARIVPSRRWMLQALVRPLLSHLIVKA